ncbi:MAG: hypothetical protein CME62_03635 [Halobacteriovoraceae bacterium]|nr:hypothetical protein [Halobacteriovoraceae bacterium]
MSFPEFFKRKSCWEEIIWGEFFTSQTIRVFFSKKQRSIWPQCICLKNLLDMRTGFLFFLKKQLFDASR